jgi:predicted SnoaL-like aldol condensation-catalyzing enzyme
MIVAFGEDQAAMSNSAIAHGSGARTQDDPPLLHHRCAISTQEYSVTRLLDRPAMLMVAVALLLAFGSTPARAGDKTQVDANRKSVVEFYEKAFNQKDFEAAKDYLGPQFIDHDPAAPADGIEGIKRFLGFLRSKFPNANFEIKRVFAEGDYVIVHAHGVREPGTPGRAIVDIFRLDHGKIVEHWDVVQDISENSPNPHPFF